MKQMDKARMFKLGVLGLLVVVLLYCATFGRGPLNHLLAYLRSLGPAAFYSGFAVLISVGVPPTPFLLGAGAVFDLPTNVIGLSLAFAFSLSVMYMYARRLFKRQLDNFMAEKAPVITGAMQDNPVTTTVLMRLIPGVPYSIQNCFLPSICGSFRVFFFSSMPPLIFMASMYVLLGKSLFQGNLAKVALLVVIVLAMLFGTSCVVKRRRAKAAFPKTLAQADS